MWIVKLALRRPYTFVVMAVLGLIAFVGMPKEMVPYINLVGKARTIMVDLSPNTMFSNHLSETDVSSPSTVEERNDMPAKTVYSATMNMRDVAQAHEGYKIQQSIVCTDGNRGTLLTVLKSSRASMLDIVKRAKERLPQIAAGLPKEFKLTELINQSVFVKAAIIACFPIPLCNIVSGLRGETIHTMTPGALALAVGIVVDDATVEIENIHGDMGMKKPITRAIPGGAQQIAIPAFVSTLAIYILFVPVLQLTGAAKLFMALTRAVVPPC